MSHIVKKGLRCHASVGAKHCHDCPYNHRAACAKKLADDALAYIETLEERMTDRDTAFAQAEKRYCDTITELRKRLATAEGMRRELMGKEAIKNAE